MRKGVIFIFSLVMIAALNSCKFRTIEKSDDWRIKYEAAVEYFESEDYYKASILFEQIQPIVRGLPEGENVSFYLAYCQYHQGYYLLASHYFQSFFETYGRSAKVMEARYMYAYSLYTDAPNENLDQTSTEEALQAMQNFINKYPDSEYREDAENILNEMQGRMEIKGYNNAFHYFKLTRYSAAVVALENFTFDFPDSELVEQAEYYRIIAQFNYAEKSVPSKQKERYQKVTELYTRFINMYPESTFIKQAEKAYSSALNKIETL